MQTYCEQASKAHSAAVLQVSRSMPPTMDAKHFDVTRQFVKWSITPLKLRELVKICTRRTNGDPGILLLHYESFEDALNLIPSPVVLKAAEKFRRKHPSIRNTEIRSTINNQTIFIDRRSDAVNPSSRIISRFMIRISSAKELSHWNDLPEELLWVPMEGARKLLMTGMPPANSTLFWRIELGDGYVHTNWIRVEDQPPKYPDALTTWLGKRSNVHGLQPKSFVDHILSFLEACKTDEATQLLEQLRVAYSNLRARVSLDPVTLELAWSKESRLELESRCMEELLMDKELNQVFVRTMTLPGWEYFQKEHSTNIRKEYDAYKRFEEGYLAGEEVECLCFLCWKNKSLCYCSSDSLRKTQHKSDELPPEVVPIKKGGKVKTRAAYSTRHFVRETDARERIHEAEPEVKRKSRSQRQREDRRLQAEAQRRRREVEESERAARKDIIVKVTDDLKLPPEEALRKPAENITIKDHVLAARLQRKEILDAVTLRYHALVVPVR